MTAPNAMLIPGLMAGIQAQPLLTTTLATPSYTFEPSNSPSSRYVLAGSLATIALGSVLVGCRSDPAPAPIPHESALPPNQGNCPPGSQDPYCMGYKASVGEMRREREEGHHSDQALTLLLVGAAVFLVGIPSAIMIIRRGRKIKRLEAELKEARPPESGNKLSRPGFFRRLFRRTPKAVATETPKNQSADSLEDATTEEATATTTKIGS